MPARSLAGVDRSAHDARPAQGHHDGSPQGRPPRREACVPGLPSDREFLDRYGDAIDDRVAEILDELLTERQSVRQPRRLAALLSVASVLLAAAAAAILLRHGTWAWAIGPAIAVIGLAAYAVATRRSL